MKYYCVGIKGAGMGTLANILKDLGNEVSGYDDDTHYKYTEDGLRDREYTSLLKIIGDYEVDKALNFVVEKMSATAQANIEKAGGKVEIKAIKSYANIASNNKKED